MTSQDVNTVRFLTNNCVINVDIMIKWVQTILEQVEF